MEIRKCFHRYPILLFWEVSDTTIVKKLNMQTYSTVFHIQPIGLVFHF